MKPVAVPPRAAWTALRYQAGRLVRLAGLYGTLIGGAAPSGPPRTVMPPWPGDPGRGRGLVSGRLTLAGRTLPIGPEGPWRMAEAPLPWRRAAHGFGWLDDLAAVGGTEARAAAQRLTAQWLEAETHRKPAADRLAWSAGATGRRVRAWLTHWPLLTEEAGASYRQALLASLGRQVRHLALVAGVEGEGADRLDALIGLVQATLMLPVFDSRQGAAVESLERELSFCILPDGCHATRSPRVQYEAMRGLVGLRAVFEALQREVPIGLVTAIDRMAPVLRFFRHGDGGLCLFNDSREEAAEDIDALLTRADARGRAPARCPHGGFERMTAEKLLVLIDAGAPPGPPFDGHAHAGPLSLEVSSGAERLIVNCGAARGSEGDWLRAQRSTAAHSTLGIADTNADEIAETGRLGRRRASTVVSRNEAEGAVWVEMSHDGYTKPFGLTHHRRLYLSAEGTDLRGEDRLEGEAGHPFTLRFHLHPKVQVSLLSSHASALLKTPSGAGWRLRATGGSLALSDSVYLGGPQESKRTQQIVLTGVTDPKGTTVKWALQRESKR
jgi:uncharacterized heparinase superfamily protein